MSNCIKYIRGIQLIRSKDEPELLVIKAKGFAELTIPFSAVLVPKEGVDIPADGILELDFRLDGDVVESTGVSMEVEVVIRMKNLPSWIQGVRINAEENSDIELL